jgi:hypothetical protein
MDERLIGEHPKNQSYHTKRGFDRPAFEPKKSILICG